VCVCVCVFSVFFVFVLIGPRWSLRYWPREVVPNANVANDARTFLWICGKMHPFTLQATGKRKRVESPDWSLADVKIEQDFNFDEMCFNESSPVNGITVYIAHQFRYNLRKFSLL
jgi:hypothetical protein